MLKRGLENERETDYSRAEKVRLEKAKHMKFARREHNYVLVNAENSRHVVLSCVGKYVFNTVYHDFAYVR